MSTNCARVTAAAIIALLAGACAGGPTPQKHACEPVSPDDPHYRCSGSWGQGYGDQWALRRIGLTPEYNGTSFWGTVGGKATPVIVAVIDSGLDYYHPDLPPTQVWRNPRERLNGRDDDGNGYVDDMIGWDFVADRNNPLDIAGHGTHVAGIIAAARNNGTGIAGINPMARIMALKVMDSRGQTPSFRVARAILYAANNGARVINLSLGGRGVSPVEQAAIAHAHHKDVLVVVASGSEGRAATGDGLVGLPNAITVAATDTRDRRASFSNWGAGIDLAAPGVDILSLRARRSDFLKTAGAPGYKAESAVVGRNRRYYRADGTSFAAPIVAGVASLLISRNASLSPTEVKRILLSTARDIEAPGWDRLTGYGLLDAKAALTTDPKVFVDARIDRIVRVGKGEKTALRIVGRAASTGSATALLEIGRGPAPRVWTHVATVPLGDVSSRALGDIPAATFRGTGQWTVRLVVRRPDGFNREARYVLNIRATPSGLRR